MLAEHYENYMVIKVAVLEPEDMGILQAVEQAWGFLPPKRRTRANKDALVAAIARLAAHGNRDRGLLSMRALSKFIPEAPCDPL